VWPWLIQMGQDRAGFFGYDGLERLVGLRIGNADTIVPEWQHLAVGDQLRVAPAAARPAWSALARLAARGRQPDRQLVLAPSKPRSRRYVATVQRLRPVRSAAATWDSS
jgi:hypothetical protein